MPELGRCFMLDVVSLVDMKLRSGGIVSVTMTLAALAIDLVTGVKDTASIAASF